MKLSRLLALALVALLPAAASAVEQRLTANDVEQILRQGLKKAKGINPRAIIAVTDREGFLLGLWTADEEFPASIGPFPSVLPALNKLNVRQRGVVRDFARVGAAITRASTAAFLSSNQNAFTTRTAGYIIQQHFPPGVRNVPPGPLVGVGFSSLFYSDVNRVKLPVDSAPGVPFDGATLVPPTVSPGVRAPLYPLTSLDDSPGGVPLYKGGELVGGVGVTGDGEPTNLLPAGAIFFQEDQHYATTGFRTGRDADEEVAVAAQSNFRPDREIVATNATIAGVRIPYVNTPADKLEDVESPPNLDDLGHQIDVQQPLGLQPYLGTPKDSPDRYPYEVIDLGGVQGEVRFPFRDDPLRSVSGRQKIQGEARLKREEVTRIIRYAAERAERTRAGIRLPIGTGAKVFISVVGNPDKPGDAPPILGVFRVGEATVFSWDVAVQKARTALFFSNSQLAMSARSVGFLSQRFFPPGLDGRPIGPLFGFQEAISLRQRPLPGNAPTIGGQKVYPPKGGLLAPNNPFLPTTLGFPGNNNLPNGLTIFPGGFPLYRHGVLIGAIGISGDGVDQDDLIGASGTVDFLPDGDIRADTYAYHGARLPYVKYPRDPEK